LARSLVSGSQGNEEGNMGSAWVDPAAAAQLLQQQQYMLSIGAAAESPAATESEASGDRQNMEPSSPDDENETTSEPRGADSQKDSDIGPSNQVPNAPNKDWLLQMYQKTQGQV